MDMKVLKLASASLVVLAGCGAGGVTGPSSSPSKFPTPFPQPQPELTGPIDTLSFFLGTKRDRVSLMGIALFRGAEMNSFYAKQYTGQDARGEIHTWDGEFIYLNEDSSPEGRGWSYQLKHARWMRRLSRIGDVVHSPDAYLTNYKPDCTYSFDGMWPVNSGPFPITTELISHTVADLGGVLGEQEIIKLRYNNQEVFTYAKEWGWVNWELTGEKREPWGQTRPTLAHTQLTCWERGWRR